MELSDQMAEPVNEQHEQTIALSVLSSSGVAGAQQARLTKDRSVIGRRPYCDLVLNDRTVSSEHAAIVRDADGFVLEDLSSRNGTLINGKAISSQRLKAGDILEVGIYRLQVQIGTSVPAGHAIQGAMLEYLTGGMRGVKQRLDKPITRISGDNQVAVISRRKTGYFITHLEGEKRPIVNGRTVGHRAVALRHSDEIDLNATRVRFRLL